MYVYTYMYTLYLGGTWVFAGERESLEGGDLIKRLLKVGWDWCGVCNTSGCWANNGHIHIYTSQRQSIKTDKWNLKIRAGRKFLFFCLVHSFTRPLSLSVCLSLCLSLSPFPSPLFLSPSLSPLHSHTCTLRWILAIPNNWMLWIILVPISCSASMGSGSVDF